MTDELLEDIMSDLGLPEVKAKTQEAWYIKPSDRAPGMLEVLGPSFRVSIVMWALDLDLTDNVARTADARRIARVPDMERRIVSDAELIARFRASARDMARMVDVMTDAAYRVGLAGTKEWDEVAGGADIYGFQDEMKKIAEGEDDER